MAGVPRLDNRVARRLFLDRHALLEQPSGPARGAALLDLIRRLGFVQIDSIMTVARAHDLILHARRPTYRPPALKRLCERDRSLFEHWTHDAAVIPMDFYPHWQLRFARDADRLRASWRTWQGAGFEDHFAPVLRHIRDNGPVCSSDLGTGEKKRRGGWWDWHPSKTALEYLWRTGALAVVGRSGFEKVYDLTERVIDERHLRPDARPDPQATIDWCCATALDRLGFATSGEIAAFWATATPAEARDWVRRAEAEGQIVAVDVAGADGRLRRCHARPETLERARDLAPAPGRIRVLSPFDPALRDRARAERLFGFHYRIEVFVPAARRRYGYYVFPLLEGDRLVGRIDMKARRETGRLEVAALWPEPGIAWSATRRRRLEAELDRIRRFAGLDGLSLADGWLRAQR